MDSKQRKEFWDTLCSLEGNDIQNDSKLLMNKVVFPHYLYRYRDVTFNNLEALRTNPPYFSSANYYDDPFDTFLHIDIEKIRAEFETNLSCEENICRLANAMKSIIENCNVQPPAEFVSLESSPQNLKKLYQMKWIPDGIILGLRMSQTEESLVISLAKQAGIKKYINLSLIKIINLMCISYMKNTHSLDRTKTVGLGLGLSKACINLQTDVK